MNINKVRFTAISALACAYWLLCAAPAYAYIDPGAGSMILQAVFGSAISGMVMIRMYWQRIIQFIMPHNRSPQKIDR